jgi:asparagine synthase (glutamine-hydrolysing)
MVFNGEVYNFEELRAELGGIGWRSHSDTEVILQSIERWGVQAAIRKFVGMFAIAIWDRDEQKLHLVRDRIGIKPLYYGQVAGSFVFASELKAICAFPGFGIGIDRGSLASYLRCGYVPSPYTIYEGIYRLLPGHVLTVDGPHESGVLNAYWSASEIAQAAIGSRLDDHEEPVLERLHAQLLEAVRLRMIADVPLGAFLSGGVDSSLVVALMQVQSPRAVKTFTLGFQDDRYNEAAHAARVAAHLGTEHTEFFVTPADAQNVVPLLPSMYDEPFADSSQIPTYLISKLARRDVTVALSGDGGDELFCGYPRYLLAERLWRVVRRTPEPAARRTARWTQSLPPAAIDHFLRRLPIPASLKGLAGHRLHRLADLLEARTPAEAYVRTASIWPDPAAIVLDAHEHNVLAHATEQSSSMPSIFEMGMLTDLTTYLPDDILTKLDRASMAASLEARVPLLDHRIVEFAWHLPLKWKVHRGTTKWALRRLLYRYVPPALVDRPKMGFSVPLDSWLRGPLRDWAEDLLSPERLQSDGFFAVAPIRSKWAEHVSGSRNWQHPLWSILMFQAWRNAAQSRTPAHGATVSTVGPSC